MSFLDKFPVANNRPPKTEDIELSDLAERVKKTGPPFTTIQVQKNIRVIQKPGETGEEAIKRAWAKENQRIGEKILESLNPFAKK